MRRVALLVGAMLAALVALSGVATISEAAGGYTTRVSVDSSGVQGNSTSLSMGGKTFISADGRYVAFTSHATNLVPGDTNDTYDVFVHEFEPDTTALRVVRTVPDEGTMDVPRGITVKANFSERVYDVEANFKLYREGSSTPVAAVVTPVEDTNDKKWVLDPDGSLKAGTIYIAKVLSGVQDKVGHDLDQNTTKGALNR